jgi:hypothetical protein
MRRAGLGSYPIVLEPAAHDGAGSPVGAFGGFVCGRTGLNAARSKCRYLSTSGDRNQGFDGHFPPNRDVESWILAIGTVPCYLRGSALRWMSTTSSLPGVSPR